MRAPIPARRPHSLVTHGDERVDDWYWLREKDNPEVIAHLEVENAHTEAAVAHLAPRREKLFEEIKSRIQETDASAPYRDGDWWYYARQLEGSQYAIRCRKPFAPTGPRSPGEPEAIPGGESVILDENHEAEGLDFFTVGSTAISPDGHLLAWAADTAGYEKYELRIRDLRTGRDLDDRVPSVSYGLAWADSERASSTTWTTEGTGCGSSPTTALGTSG